MTAGTRESRRVSGLDGLRGAAVLVVVGSHVTGRLGNGGYLGVELFFVVSGFLITSLLLKERSAHGSVSLGYFYVRRALRLLPALLLLLGVLLAVALAAPERFRTPHPLAAELASLLYVGNWYRIAEGGSGLLNHTWSLAVEEQFYLLWPPVLLLMLGRGRQRWRLAAGVLGGLVVGVFLLRLALNGRVPFDRIYAGSDTRADSLLLGSLFAVLLAHGRLDVLRRRQKLTATALVAGSLTFALVVLSPGGSIFTYSRGVSFSAALCLVIVVGVVTEAAPWINRLLEGGAARWVGVRSYGIYLWHYPMIVLVEDAVGGDVAVRALTAMASLGVAAASYRYVEKPMLDRKSRFERARLVEADVHEPGPSAPRRTVI